MFFYMSYNKLENKYLKVYPYKVYISDDDLSHTWEFLVITQEMP